MPDESTISRSRHRLEKPKPAEQILSTVNELPEAQGLLLMALLNMFAQALVHHELGRAGTSGDQLELPLRD